MNLQEAEWYYLMMKEFDQMLEDNNIPQAKNDPNKKESKVGDNCLYVSWNTKNNQQCQK